MSEMNASRFFDEHLRGFVPPNSFDSHAHLYRRADAVDTLPDRLEDESGNVGWQSWRQSLSQWMGDRAPSAGLFFTFPKPTLDRVEANRFVVDEVQAHADSRALLMIHPDDDPSAVEAEIRASRSVGFKVYHVYAERPDTTSASCHEFIPEWAWTIADELGLVFMLHMVRPRALADPLNQQYIREHCQRYPNARLILAHAARGFCGAHTVEGIGSLRGLDNVYFDTSAICEPHAFEAILREFGPSRLLFGTDFPVSEFLGRCVSIGDGFLWLYENTLDWKASGLSGPILVGLESLLALKQACTSLRLTDSDVEQIFCHSARRLLGLKNPNDGHETQDAYQRAKQIIPGGTQLLSKQPEMYAPDRWPAYFAEARGCEVIDLDGRRFCDMTTSGIGSCLLGYADPDVVGAVVRRVELGSMSTLNAVEEVELAKLLISLHPWAKRVRYCRTGGESMAAAVRIAHTHTGRDRIAFCGYHGWTDWYLAANLPDRTGEESAGKDRLAGHLLSGLESAGVPKMLGGTALPFAYNCLDELQAIVEKYGEQLAAIVMEPTRSTNPEPGFLEGVRSLCDQCGAVLIFDEITAGWRMHLGGIHLRYGIEPDMVVYAKAMSNGHPMGAILGIESVMDAVQDSFISSTYWTEGVGPAAALATLRKMQQVDLPAHAKKIGGLFRDGWHRLGTKHNVLSVASGHPAILHLGFDHADAAALGTLLTVRMLERGFLTGSGFYPALTHTEAHVAAYMNAADSVFAELAKGISENNVRQRLGTPVRKSGFQRLT